MDTTYSKAVALAVPVFLLLIAVELFADRFKRTYYYRLADAINSLSCGIVSTGMRVFTGFLGIFTYEWVLNHLSPIKLPASNWMVWVFALVFYDFCYYWNHRLGHTMGIFWAAHVVHHQSEEFNLTTALRQSGTGTLTGWIFYLPMALCGVPLGVFLLVGVVQLFYQFWPHTQLIGRMGFLNRWIQTPSNHRVHHAQNDIYLDKNYVGIFMIWDHLFGSFQEELEEEPCIYGIRGQLKSWNPVWANLHYYWAMAQDSWYAKSWVDKVRIWLSPPGWRPADVTARLPKRPYDLQRDFSKFSTPLSTPVALYVFLQFVVLILANSHFLASLPNQPISLNILYFMFILASLITLGGVMENRREFLALEFIRMIVTALLTAFAGSWFGGVHDPRILAGIEGFGVLSVAWLWLGSRVPARPVAQATA